MFFPYTMIFQQSTTQTKLLDIETGLDERRKLKFGPCHTILSDI